MNQHYVPRVYLKNFAKKKGKEYHASVFDKNTSKYFETNIKNICAENNVYTLPENNLVAKHELAIENLYANYMEPVYEKAYGTLTNDDIFSITKAHRIEIIVGIFHLYFRNPILLKRQIGVHFENIRVEYENAIKNNVKGLTYLEEDFSFREWNLEEIQQSIFDKLIGVFKEQHLLATREITASHESTVIEVQKIMDDSCNFLSNDNPLFFLDVISGSGNPFLKSNEFTIPLNKKYAAKFYHDNTKRKDLIYRCKTLSGNVNMLNDEIYNRSFRFVIGNQETLNDLQKHKRLFDETSVDLKVSLMEQILSNEKIMKESDQGTEIIRKYYNLYLENKTLADVEQHEMLKEIKKLNAITKQQKIE